MTKLITTVDTQDKWRHNIKIGLNVIGRENVECVRRPGHMVRWQTLVNGVKQLYIWLPSKVREFVGYLWDCHVIIKHFALRSYLWTVQSTWPSIWQTVNLYSCYQTFYKNSTSYSHNDWLSHYAGGPTEQTESAFSGVRRWQNSTQFLFLNQVPRSRKYASSACMQQKARLIKQVCQHWLDPLVAEGILKP